MLPVLQRLGDGEDHPIKDLVNHLADQFKLSAEDRTELLESGRQSRLANRVAWAVTHLAKAQLLNRPGRGVVKITEAGIDLLKRGPSHVDMKLLITESADYRAFRAGGPADGPELPVEPVPPPPDSPEEVIEEAYRQLTNALADDPLNRVFSLPPAFFEQLVVDLLVAMGYGGSRRDAGLAVGKSGDGGIDGVIKEDRLGLDQVYVQAKRWQGPVGQPVVREFAGSLEGHRARKAVLITTSHFTKDAYEYVGRIEKRIVLIDGPQLAAFVIEHGVGVVEKETYRLRRLDEDYFEKV